MQKIDTIINWNSFSLINPFAMIHKKWLIINVFAALVNAAVDVLSGYYIKYLTDSTLKGKNPNCR
jgi:hypothetical protein